jgi:DNA topoisomerase-1
MSGRYGPYVKWGKINATLPADKAPEETTLEEGIALVNARAGKGRAKRAATGKSVKPIKTAKPVKVTKTARRVAKPEKPAAKTGKRSKKATAPDKVSA